MVRDARGCPLPRWEPELPSEPQTEPDCAVLAIPHWFTTLLQKHRRRLKGLTSRDLYADEMILLEALDGALARGERLESERRKHREEVRRQNAKAAKVFGTR